MGGGADLQWLSLRRREGASRCELGVRALPSGKARSGFDARDFFWEQKCQKDAHILEHAVDRSSWSAFIMWKYNSEQMYHSSRNSIYTLTSPSPLYHYQNALPHSIPKCLKTSKRYAITTPPPSLEDYSNSTLCPCCCLLALSALLRLRLESKALTSVPVPASVPYAPGLPTPPGAPLIPLPATGLTLPAIPAVGGLKP